MLCQYFEWNHFGTRKSLLHPFMHFVNIKTKMVQKANIELICV